MFLYLKYLIVMFLGFIAIDLSCQHVEEFLAMTLEESWLNKNKVRKILVYEKWPNKRGRIKNRKRLIYSYTDSLGRIYNDQKISICEYDSLKIRCFKQKKTPEYCYSEYIENGKVVKSVDEHTINYMNYNSDGQLISIWSDHKPSIEGRNDEISLLIYGDNGRLQKELEIKLICNESGDHTNSYLEFPVKSVIKSELEYDDYGRLTKVCISKGFNLTDLHIYRVLKYSYTSEGMPLSTTYYDLINNYEIVESQFEFKYIYK